VEAPEPMDITGTAKERIGIVKEESGLTSNIRKIETEEGGHSWLSSCPYCESEWGDLVGHIKYAHKGKAWKGIRTLCPIDFCGKHVVDIKNHIRMVHDKVRNFTCPQCNNTFVNSNRLNFHIETVHTATKSTCPHCKIDVKTPYLLTHIKKYHEEGGQKPRVVCNAGCDKSYTSKADMDRHVLRVHLKYKVKCEFCEKSIDPDQMSRHVKKVHQGIFKYYCKICQAGFDYQRSLRFHISNTHTGTFVICNIPKKGEEGHLCKKNLRTEEGIFEHIKTHIGLDTKVRCGECDLEVYSCFLQDHIRTHHTKYKKQCVLDGCDAEYFEKDELRRHVYDAHGPIMEHMDWCHECSKPCFLLQTHIKNFHTDYLLANQEYSPVYKLVIGLMCQEDGCKFFAVNQHALDRHTKQIHELEITHKCEECGVHIRDLEKHINDFHSKTKSHVCDVCNKGFISKPKLRMHKLTHTRTKQVCEICSSEVIKLKQHMELVHDQAPKLPCDVEGCTTTFFNKHGKNLHIKHVHQGIKYKCDQCDKEVVNLRMHKRIVHEKVRKHVCPECGKTFQMTAHLRLHIARVHLKLREKCPECGKQVQDLYAHNLYVHKKERNFPCDQCDARLYTSFALKSHIESVHLGERVKCPDCSVLFAKAYINKHRKQCFSKHSYAKFRCKLCNKRFLSIDNLERHMETKHPEEEANLVPKKEEP